MKTVILFLAIIAFSLLTTGCAHKVVMKNCIPMGSDKAEELKEFFACEQQFTIWGR